MKPAANPAANPAAKPRASFVLPGDEEDRDKASTLGDGKASLNASTEQQLPKSALKMTVEGRSQPTLSSMDQRQPLPAVNVRVEEQSHPTMKMNAEECRAPQPESNADKEQQPAPTMNWPPRILFGEALQHDKRIAKISAREKFLLTVIIPRIRSTRDALREWFGRSMKSTVWIPCLVAGGLQVGFMVLCAFPQCSFLCAYGPDPEDDERSWYAHAFKDYGPPMISVLASLMLSFYANVCMGLYKDGYIAAQSLKASVIDLMAMVVGTIPVEYAALRTEFWRCANLYHLCSYVLADKSRATYNVDNFLVPVATAYGPYDNEIWFGMLRRQELDMLDSHLLNSTTSTLGMPSGLQPAHQLHTGIIGKALAAVHLKPSEDRELSELRHHKKGSTSARSSHSRTWGSSSSVLSSNGGSGRLNVPPPAGKNKGRQMTSARRFVNSRGDVSSKAAVLHAAIGIRLYMLVDLVIAEKLSKAAWPAWNALCMRLREGSETMKQRSLFRLPRIYQASVRFLVASTILVDTIVLASHASRLIRHGQGDSEWLAHAYFGAVLDLFLNLLLTWCLAIFLDAVADMQTPFGSEGLDMPGLSYVCAASELSLRMVHGGSGRKFGFFSAMNDTLDKDNLLQRADTSKSPVKRRSKTPGKLDEEEEDDDADE